MRRLLALCITLALAAPVGAAPLTITKTATAISDPLANTLPRTIPGAVVDYKVLAVNPLANATTPVRSVVLTDPLPANMILRVSDLNAGKGPVEFADGNLLGTGLLASGLSYTYSAAAPATDGLEFWNGATWTYQPVADANGYDVNVRAVRVTLTGTFTAATQFQLRYRMKIR